MSEPELSTNIMNEASQNDAENTKTSNNKLAESLQDDLAEMQTDGWSRVSPLAIIYFFAKTLFFLINNVLLYSIPALAAGYSSIKENPFILIIGVAVLLFLILITSVIKYWFYRYKFSDDRVEIKQGVVQKSHMDLPFKKIQNVKIVQPFYYRFKQYSFIELDTAGSSQQEAKIVALPIAMAESFKHLILQIKHDDDLDNAHHLNGEADNKAAVGSEILLNQRSIKDLVIHGITNNRVWIVLGFLAPFYNTIADNISGVLNSMGLDLAAYLDYQSQSIGLFVLHLFSIVMLIMLVMVSLSVIGSIFVFYQYRLSRQDDRYIRRSGLFTKQEVSMRLSRIQVAIQQQDWLDIVLGRTNLRFEQNTSLPNAAQAGNINNASKLIVPSVTLDESMTLIQDSFDVKRFDELPFKAISKRFIIRVLAFPILPIISLLTTIAISAQFSMPGWAVVAVISALLLVLTYVRWIRWGYFFDREYVYIRKGLLGVNYYVFPKGKTQQIKFKQSLFMRKRQLADVQYVLASGAHTVPLVPQSEARQQIDDALYIVEKFKPTWM